MKYTRVLCTVTVILTVMIVGLPVLHAQDAGVTVTSSSLDNTIIVTISNTGSVGFSSVKLWLDEGNTFTSFKTSGGWTGVFHAPNLVSFDILTPIVTGESSKFGVVTELPTEVIYWQALDSVGSEISRNKTIPGVVSTLPPPSSPTNNIGTGDLPSSSGSAIIDGSTFRIIPTMPHVGSQIRVVGEGFNSMKTVTLLLGSLNLSEINTGDSGKFVHTATTPQNSLADRVEFTLTDGSGGILTKSVRLGESINRLVPIGSAVLTFNDVPVTITGGDTVNLSGIGSPGEFIILTMKHPVGFSIAHFYLRIDSNGSWEKSFPVPVSSSLGRYTAIITDGETSIQKSFDVQEGNIINVLTSRLSYTSGDLLIFRGTATPNEPLLIRLSSPQNMPLYEDKFLIDSSGDVSFEIPTTTSYLDGTYTLFLMQGLYETVIPIGIGNRASDLFVIETDKLNYESNDTAMIKIRGVADSTATLSVSNTKVLQFTTPIMFDIDGLYTHSLDLSDYSRGIYIATVNYGKNSADIDFGVSIPHNSGTITVSTIKSNYDPNEPIIVLGTTEKVLSLVDIILESPSGLKYSTDSVFSFGPQTGKFQTVFFIHSDPEIGAWKVIAKSGINITETYFNVTVVNTEGLVVRIEEISSPTGTSMLISGDGAPPSRQIEIAITHNFGEIIQDTQLVRSTASGTFSITWSNSDDLPIGTYTITATDSDGHEAQTSLVVE